MKEGFETQSDHEASEQLRRLEGSDRRRFFDALAGQYRDQLKRMVVARLETTLRKRVDPSDVVQDGLIAAYNRLDCFLDRDPMRFDLWLRQTTLERLIDLRRRHYAQQRDVRAEIPLSSDSLQVVADELLADRRSVNAIQRTEELAMVGRAFAALDERDREVLMLRYVDELTNQEAAAVLGIAPAACSKRHGRALVRLASELHRAGYGSEERR